ncbi:hypothetical protein WR25_22262 [Diploscapter pachys]|uniref:Saccharopine dehydrogenase NADP binding domain-containing protein n=1 Tax=Diploscapter pachys TaxID=2018661 RepID=A0A2A2LGH3_9BILA|nr:hypothetical protein WR25_22262 [Diploscapter pachys]
MTRYDVVVYGATGYTGAYIGTNFAVAGRNESKIKKTLAEVSKRTGANLSKVPIIIADNSDEASLANMAKQANLIINAVGPYRLYGEAVVRAAVENGANHIDISGEPAFLEQMALKYGEEAKKKGLYVVGACGWDSIPCDLGVKFLKKNFHGDLSYIESYVQTVHGPAGYAINNGTYQTLVLGIANMAKDKLGPLRKQLMPERITKPAQKPPAKGKMFSINEKELDGWAVPFMGSDKAIVNRSQYYDATVRGERPVHIETYFRIGTMIRAIMLFMWLSVFAILAQFAPTRKFLQDYPDLCSFNMFKKDGPTEEQVKQSSFNYWLFGYGYDSTKPVNEQHEGKPNRRVVSVCHGPDAGYSGTSACAVGAAMTILKNKDGLPKDGGVFTTAAAFGESKIFEYLEQLGVTYKIVSESSI